MDRRASSLLILVASAFAFVSCTPPYPQCKTDEHCKTRPEPKTDKLMWCVKGQCVQCRDNADCPEGEECTENACKPIPGYCSANKPCPPDQKCRNNRCGPVCSAEFPCPPGEKCQDNKCVPDVECSDTEPKIPCPPGKICKDNKCVPEPQCGPAKPCPKGQECKDGKCEAIEGYCDEQKPCPANMECKDNRCVAKPPPACELKPIYFDFDKSEIREDQKKTLDDNAACMKQQPEKKLMIEGNCDERGTKEYNIALGERRWKSVRDALKAAGIGEDKMEGISYGEEKPVCTEHKEECWQKNRRAEAKFK
jgi:peptidoglycan-associated lipoprotein